jgi:hypothetical protein
VAQDKNTKSDRFQTLTAVLFMALFAAVFLLIAVPKGNVTSLVCNYLGTYDVLARMCSNLPSVGPAGPDHLVTSRITSACIETEGLRISVAFDQPLTGATHIQVFTTGDDYFPSEQGISDSFKMSMTIPSAANQVDFMIPVDSMPVGEQIFGNFAIKDEGVSSFVAYSMNVTDCSRASETPSGSTPDEIPMIDSATCLPSQHLMIAFAFESEVLGQYRASVADIPYELASVINKPATLFFSGELPPEGPVVIRLVSATNETTVFEETYTPPICGTT